MKQEFLDIHPQFIVDQNGKKTGVIMNIETFQELIEKIEELYFGSLAQDSLKNEAKFNDFNHFKNKILK